MRRGFRFWLRTVAGCLSVATLVHTLSVCLRIGGFRAIEVVLALIVVPSFYLGFLSGDAAPPVEGPKS